jgi:hypothetical protein
MTSHTTKRFRQALRDLPQEVRRQAREAYKLFVRDPHHPSLRFRRVHPTEPIYSARIGAHYRALGTLEGDEIVWFWIGPHAEYDRLIRQR